MNKARIKKPKMTFSWMNPKLEVQETESYGKGVFAKKNIKKNEPVAIFGGYILTAKEESLLSDKYRDTGVQIADNFILTSREKKEDVDYINHSCNPNVGYNGQIFVVAMRDIRKSEEITFDYAMVLHRSKNVKRYKMKCLCGAKNCRRVVTDNDWRKSELQKKYNGYFQYYLQDKINKLRKIK